MVLRYGGCRVQECGLEVQRVTPVHLVPEGHSCTPRTRGSLLYTLYQRVTPVYLVPEDHSCTPRTRGSLLYTLYQRVTPVHLVPEGRSLLYTSYQRVDHSCTPRTRGSLLYTSCQRVTPVHLMPEGHSCTPHARRSAYRIPTSVLGVYIMICL